MLDITRVRRSLNEFDLRTLFIEELGWDHDRTRPLDVSVDGSIFRLEPIAQKRGMVAYRCDAIPEYATRRKIEREALKAAFEHLIIFTEGREQVWQWDKREQGRPAAVREHRFRRGQSGDSLIQKLDYIAVALEEEERIANAAQMARRARSGFDVERVTRRFYDRFKNEHAAFLKFVKGIPDERLERWYVSVMLNRLMFIYFIQMKGFLDNDPDYLRNRLKASKAAGRDRFYRDFLCPLFFEGFARREGERSPGMDALLGKIPYLNGGLFERHQIEERYGAQITIPDAAFEALFDFFDAYQWRLDERPAKDDNEINPDVLGYIFEKYINQKQMGAYYTKEDITGYISQNTIIPYLFDAATDGKRINGAADEKRISGWELLQVDPDRYIYPAVRHGITWDIHAGKALTEPLPLPEEIAVGVNPPTLHDPVGEGPVATLEARKAWNRAAPPEYALPTETWREVVARRQRYAEIRAKLAAGEVHDINDLITYNLDIRQFAQDVIRNAGEPDLLRAFWKAIRDVTVLDPTVGSGAFLFAALNVLEPLYEACLERMEAFVGDLDRAAISPLPAGEGPGVRSATTAKFSDFRAVLQETEAHPNARYFILKSIMVNNLYGVDIMEEAVEICKLRMFLKLAAQVEEVAKLEPLPDIDFNVRAGNTLVGYVKREDVQRALTVAANENLKLLSAEDEDAMARIEEKLARVDAAAALFRQQQTALGGQVSAADKAALRALLDELAGELDHALSLQYGIDPKWQAKFAAWKASHQPFHWFAEFHTILARGGFDVVIGNPPYVEWSAIQGAYRLLDFTTSGCGNLYAFVFERTTDVLRRLGNCGLIIPTSAVSTERMETLQAHLAGRFAVQYLSHFSGDRNPAELFTGVKNRLTIVVGLGRQNCPHQIFSTPYLKWYTAARSELISRLIYVPTSRHKTSTSIPKLGTPTAITILDKITFDKQKLASYFSQIASMHEFYYHNAPIHWVRAFTFAPYFWNEREGHKKSSQLIGRYTRNETAKKAMVTVMNSTIFFWFWLIYSDCYHLTSRELNAFPLDLGRIATENSAKLCELSDRLMGDFQKHSVIKEASYRTTGQVRYQEIDPKKSKPIIDEIDTVLARHYGFTEEELDFIINYDIKYRMGRGATDDGATDENG